MYTYTQLFLPYLKESKDKESKTRKYSTGKKEGFRRGKKSVKIV